MYYFQKFFGNYMIKSNVLGNNEVVSYASLFKSGEIGLVIVNKDVKSHNIKVNTGNFKSGKRYYLYSLSGGKDNGDFSQCVFVNGHGPDYKSGGPIKNLENLKAYSFSADKAIIVASPSYSVQFLLIENNKK
jgi:hypothetical protein